MWWMQQPCYWFGISPPPFCLWHTVFSMGLKRQAPPTLVKCISHVLNQGQFPDNSLKTTGDEIPVQCWEVARSALPGVETFLSPFSHDPNAKGFLTQHLPSLHLFTGGRPGCENVSEMRHRKNEEAIQLCRFYRESSLRAGTGSVAVLYSQSLAGGGPLWGLSEHFICAKDLAQ